MESETLNLANRLAIPISVFFISTAIFWLWRYSRKKLYVMTIEFPRGQTEPVTKSGYFSNDGEAVLNLLDKSLNYFAAEERLNIKIARSGTEIYKREALEILDL